MSDCRFFFTSVFIESIAEDTQPAQQTRKRPGSEVMKLCGPLLLLMQLLLSVRHCLAESLKGTIQQSTLYSCQRALSVEFHFDCADGYWPCSCYYEPLAASIVECMDNYLPETVTKESGRLVYAKACLKFAQLELTLDEIEARSQNASKWIRSSDDPSWNHTEPQHTPVLVDKYEVVSKIRDYRAFLGNFDIAQYWGIGINLYWVGVCLWFGLVNHTKKMRRLNSRLIGPKINAIRQTFTLPLLFGSHQDPFTPLWKITSLLPSSAESLALAIYFIIHTVSLVQGIEIYDDNSLFGPGSSLYQFCRITADRAGVLAFAHFPILILFAGRNNILISISQLPYSTFMIFHKWTARIMVVDAAIHTVLYTSAMLVNGRFKSYFASEWFIAGWVAMALCTLIILLAVHNLRVRYYELFLVTHIVFAVFFFLSCWGHCVEFGWLDWIAGSMLIWCADRVVRLYRLCKFGAPRAQILFCGDETFKVIVKRPHSWKPYPGCFVFIHFLHWSIFWQSHPFTIVDSVLEDEEITIYIKAKGGATSRVMNMLAHNGTTTMRVSLEGPYGNQSPVENYDTVMLFAGGNGIPGPFYHALHLAERSLIMRQRIVLIWVVRSVESIQWFEPELRRLAKTGIECDIYITRKFKEEDVGKTPILAQYADYVRFHAGRVPHAKLLGEEFKNAKGTIGIVTCGPGRMCDDIRSYVAEHLDDCLHRVDLFEELQVW